MRTRPSTLNHLAVLGLITTLSAATAFAQESAFYGALNLGGTGTHFDAAALRSALQARGFSPSSLRNDDEDSGWKLTGAYSFNDMFAVEANYADLGEFKTLATSLTAARQLGQAEVRGFGLDLVASVPLNARVAAFGRLGIARMEVEQEFSNPALGAYFADRSDRGTHEKYGAGLQYQITDAFAVRAELERYRTEDNHVTEDNASMVSLGLVYRLGMRRPPVERRVVTEPTPAPRPAPPVTIRLAASALFDFDRSELKPAGKAELDKLVQDLRGLTYEVILVTGHTDRIGTREYNLALSERRARTVRDYLTAAGIAPGQIMSRGVNSDMPVTRPGQCEGPVSDALKACLQPDRRVEVEVSGTREAR